MKFSKMVEAKKEFFANQKVSFKAAGGKRMTGYIDDPEPIDGAVMINGKRVDIASITPMEEGAKEYDKYVEMMLRKHGYTNFANAAKDKKFMDALDRGWQAKNEAVRDGDGVLDVEDYKRADKPAGKMNDGSVPMNISEKASVRVGSEYDFIAHGDRKLSARHLILTDGPAVSHFAVEPDGATYELEQTGPRAFEVVDRVTNPPAILQQYFEKY